MAKIEFPKHLKALLEHSSLEAPIRALADRVGEILTDNKLTFFPDYTDHGVDHINDVLKSEVGLVPKNVWEQSKNDSDPRLLCDADAVVIIGATLLHDIAMHLQPPGFLELIGKDSRFKPLTWFRDSHEGHSADKPWDILWEEYQLEARRFSDQKLANIIGEESALVWKYEGLPKDTGQWERNHYLIIGEFIRRHHARLAHEIALFGFPGLPIGSGKYQFPAMGAEEEHILADLADLIGLTARSHGTSLRVCTAYLESHPPYSGTSRPMGSAVLYPMALLRVADYLQIDQKRTPPVLLQLRDPQSPISVMEWMKHKAVQYISSSAKDPRGLWITVSSEVSLPLYLQLRDLLGGLQKEIDHSTAVLDEAYGLQVKQGLDMLNLEVRRVHSNLQNPEFLRSLPFVPERIGFSSDPDLLALLVEPLYGKEPSVGVRELMQNAVDAVRELDFWCKDKGKCKESLNLPKIQGDVQIDFIEQEDASWILRVTDRGIGMKDHTIQNYFLRAGASFRRSPEWAEAFRNEQGQALTIRAGRFGIGAFSTFLIGKRFRLWTRHVDNPTSEGYSLELSPTNQLIEIKRTAGLPIGTTIEVALTRDSSNKLGLDSDTKNRFRRIEEYIGWYCWDWPVVVKRICDRQDNVFLVQQKYFCPSDGSSLPLHWNMIEVGKFDAVFWTYVDAPKLVCNGFVVGGPTNLSNQMQKIFDWPKNIPLVPPKINLIDREESLPLTIQRYKLTGKNLPFISELSRDAIISYIAHAIVCGANSLGNIASRLARHPMDRRSQIDGQNLKEVLSHFPASLLPWAATVDGMVPCDGWLFPLLPSRSCIVYGRIGTVGVDWQPSEADISAILMRTEHQDCALVPCNIEIGYHGNSGVKLRDNAKVIGEFLFNLASYGVLGKGEVLASRLICTKKSDWYFPRKWFWHDLQPASLRRNIVEGSVGQLVSNISLTAIHQVLEEAISADDEIVFVAEIKMKGLTSPVSRMATIWNECLGPRFIPFDQEKRRALVEKGKQHLELNRHIIAWENINRTNLKLFQGE